MEPKKTSILIVDDDPDVATMLKHYLSLRQYTVFTAKCGHDAIVLLGKEKIDTVILDVVMHGINGNAIAKTIKERFPHIKIIVITGYPDAGRQIAGQMQVEGLFFKPAGMQELYHKLLAC